MRAFSIERLAKIYAYDQPVSMALSFNGLAKIVTQQLNKKVETGDCFLFLNKRRNYLKILFWANNGQNLRRLANENNKTR